EASAFMRGQTVKRLAGEADATLFMAERAAHAVDQRALAGAVRADQTNALAIADIEVDRVERDETTEALAKVGYLQDCLAGHCRGLGRKDSTRRTIESHGGPRRKEWRFARSTILLLRGPRWLSIVLRVKNLLCCFISSPASHGTAAAPGFRSAL